MLKKFFVLAFALFLFWPVYSFATSGACSGHGGVSCSSGSDYDGSVICNDGWRNSSVSYSSMVMCGGGSSYSSDYNSYTSTPSCPLNSSPDILTSGCKCNLGYVSSGGSCISGSSYCYDKHGYSSSYDMFDNSCGCSSGYAFDTSGQCVSLNSMCQKQMGYSSKYNSLYDKCECSYGYEIGVTGKCEYKTATDDYDDYSSTYTPTAPASNTSCPVNSSPGIDGKGCYCNDGYKVNLTKDACILDVPVPLPVAAPTLAPVSTPKPPASEPKVAPKPASPVKKTEPKPTVSKTPETPKIITESKPSEQVVVKKKGFFRRTFSSISNWFK